MSSPINPAADRSSGAAPTDSRLEIDTTRARQTDKPAAPFRDVLAGGVSLLMSGAEVATHVVAGPVMAAAVHDARVGAVGAISGSASAWTPSTVNPAASLGIGIPGAMAGATGTASSIAAATGLGGTTGTSTDTTNVQGMVQDSQTSNMQLLALQEQIQNESQQFTTVSNVMRAKYDTAKSAVSNIRA